VIKFPPYYYGYTYQINITGSGSKLRSEISSHGVATFTARDDNTVGETIAGSTGTPTGYYGNAALYFDYSSTAVLSALSNVRIRYAKTGISYYNGIGHELKHSQLINCETAFQTYNSEVLARNVLVANDSGCSYGTGYGCGRVVSGSSPSALRGENMTVHRTANFNVGNYASILLTNCLVVEANGLGYYSGLNNSVLSSGAGVFQSVGGSAATRYLASDSYRNSGTLEINPGLLADLRQRTTYAPQELTADFTAPTVLLPRGIADTGPIDQGYHYPIIDYAWSGRNLSSTLLLTNGVSVAHFGTAGTFLQAGAKFISEGSPLYRNHWVDYALIQENAVVWGTAGSTFAFLATSGAQATPAPEIYCRFTDVNVAANVLPKRHLLQHANDNLPQTLLLRDCEVTGAYLVLSNSSSATVLSPLRVGLTNNIWRRASFTIRRDAKTPLAALAFNNLFLGGTLAFQHNLAGTPGWEIKDNVFDSASLTAGTVTIPNGNNAYVLTTFLPGSLGGDKQPALRDYQPGPLGAYYYPASGGSSSLASLINAGSRTAAAASLYHYTVKVDQTKAGAYTPPAPQPMVSIGYHYVAVATSGAIAPVDTDGEGLADWREDVSGDGVKNSSETDIGSSDTDSDLLSDYQEVVLVGLPWTVPTDPDSDDDGIIDGRDDIDNDLISTKAELEIYSSNPTDRFSLNKAANGRSINSDSSYLCTAPMGGQTGDSKAQLVLTSSNPQSVRLTLVEATGTFTYDIYFARVLGAPLSLYVPGYPNQTVFDVPNPGGNAFFRGSGAADSDGDGLSDGYECLVSFTMIDQFGGADSDGDGMSDGWEVANGLNPRSNDATSDTDGDGLTNLQEFQQRTNPRGDQEPLGPSSRRTALSVSEIMYFSDQGNAFDFVEVFNSAPIAENISGFGLLVKLTQDGAPVVTYTFPPNTVLPPNGFLAIAQVPANIPDSSGNVIGPYSGSIPDTSGFVVITNRLGAVLLEAAFSRELPWPSAAANTGHSLILSRASFGERNPTAWSASDVRGGSPGGVEPFGSEALRPIVINELVLNGTSPFIELYNHGNQSVDIAGAVLTDVPSQNKYIFPSGSSTIAARGFLTVSLPQASLSPALSGGTIYLKNASGTRIIDSIAYAHQSSVVSFGRSPDGATWHEISLATMGTPNNAAALRIRDVVINEIMYNPMSGSNDYEFVEIHNKGTVGYDLSGWRITGGIEYIFEPGATLSAGAYLVVAKNKTILKAAYPGILSDANTLGPFSGNLNNSGERIAVLDNAGVLVDEVSYGTGGRWGKWSDGLGSSLELIDPRSDNRLAPNWTDSDDSSKVTGWTEIHDRGLLDHGLQFNTQPQFLEITAMGPAEFLLDDIEVNDIDVPQPAQRINNTGFDSDLQWWETLGNHVQTTHEPGIGRLGTGSMRVRATGRGDTGPNKIRTQLSADFSVGPDYKARIRGYGRWLRGNPLVVMRIRGNHLEAAGKLAVPSNLGSPGQVNTRYAANVGPAIVSVRHEPVLPAANQPVVVSARIHDVDGVAFFRLYYRVNSTAPPGGFNMVNLVDNGTGGDAVANDGLWSASIPSQAAGTIISFYLEASDAFTPPATSKFPSDAPTRECLIRWGDSEPLGALPTYRIWMAQSTHDTWSSRNKADNLPLDVTFLYGGRRVVYNVGASFGGSQFKASSYPPYPSLFDTPTGRPCGYNLDFPPDDEWLGEAEVTLDYSLPDPSKYREQVSHWIAGEMGLQSNHRRFVHLHVNGVSQISRPDFLVAEDVQQPNREMVRQWFPSDSDGELFKTDFLYEWNTAMSAVFGGLAANFQNYLTRDLVSGRTIKKKARYRWNFGKRANLPGDDNYEVIFAAVDALNAPDLSFVALIDDVLDSEQWTRVFAFEDAISNWDSYGNEGQKNMYLYKPSEGKARLLVWDLDLSLGNYDGEDLATEELFDSQQNDSTIYRMMGHSPDYLPARVFQRAYWRGLKDAINGVMLPDSINPVIEARHAALVNNGISIATPVAETKDWVQARRNYILGQLPAESSFEITSNSGVDLSTSDNPFVLSGTAPFPIKDIKITGPAQPNGVVYPVTWVSLSTWQAALRLNPGANVISIQGLDRNGMAINGATDSITITYTGVNTWPAGQIFVNEWMANNSTAFRDPADGQFEDWFEIFNAGSTAFDLSGYYLTCNLASPFQFSVPSGVVIPPGGFLLVWADNETGQNGLNKDVHCNFQLNASGEAIGIFTPSGLQIDGISFSAQPSDQSHGRFPDGQTQQASQLYRPTPRRMNVTP
jgi:hypothetical protein